MEFKFVQIKTMYIMKNPFEEIEQRLISIESLILDLRKTPVPSEGIDKDHFITIKEAGKLLNLSVPTLYGYVSKRKIPYSKKGKRLYFSREELINWLSAGRVKTVSEIEAEFEVEFSKAKKS